MELRDKIVKNVLEACNDAKWVYEHSNDVDGAIEYLKSSILVSLEQIEDVYRLAVDDEMSALQLGVTNCDDSLATAKDKLNLVICANIDFALDPKLNGGYELVPLKEIL